MRAFFKKAISLGGLAIVACGPPIDDAFSDPSSEDPSSRETTAEQHAEAITIPNGWVPLSLSPAPSGIRIYTNNSNSYVTILDMRQARIKLLRGSTVDHGDFDGVMTKSAASFWTDAKAQDSTTSKARVVFGGTFGSVYGASSKESGIAFGLKTNGTLISKGYAVPGVGTNPENQYTNLVKLFTINNSMQRAWIGPYGSSSFGSPDVVGGLDVTADKGKNNLVARTFVGVRDDNNDGNYETVMVITSKASTQATAASVLSSFGAQAQIMLDGSGSTFITIDGVMKFKTDDRYIPQATAFYSGL